MRRRREFRKNLINYRRWLSLELAIIFLFIAIVSATFYISDRHLFPFLNNYQSYIVSAEIAFVSILLGEIIGRIIVFRFRERGALAYGIYVRTVIRVIAYLVAVIAIISVLASNPALAISIGTITGVVIGFASQNITANVLAAALIVATRIVHVGDTVTVSGNTGRVTDITLIYTVIDTETGTVFVPNSIMVTTAVQRRKPESDGKPQVTIDSKSKPK